MILVMLVIFCQLPIVAQNKHYLYIHNTNNQPFNLKLDHRIYVSDQKGVLIIPKLDASNIQFSIITYKGNQQYPSFEIPLNDQNQGWDLTIEGDNAKLQNWVTKEVLQPNSHYTTENWWNGSKKKDNYFAQMMADVVADTAVLYNTNTIIPSVKYTEIAKVDPLELKNNPSITTEEIASIDSIDQSISLPDTTTKTIEAKEILAQVDSLQTDSTLVAVSEVRVDTVSIKTDSSIAKVTYLGKDTNQVKIDSTVNTAVALKKDSILVKAMDPVEEPIAVKVNIQKQKDSTTSAGRFLSFELKENNQKEVVDVFIPTQEEVKIIESAITKIDSSKIVKQSKEEVKEEEVKELVPEKSLVIYNSDCKEVSTDSDIDKYRVRLMGLKQEQRFAQMQKYLKAKCITTKQIRALSELFPTDDDKFQLFELSYPFVDETSSFKTLIELLESDLNKTKFKQMTRMQ